MMSEFSSWTEPKHRQRLEILARSFDKSIKLHTKDNWFCKVIAWLLGALTIIFTLGFKRYNKKAFFSIFATAIANHHFYPEEWTPWQVESALPHEGRGHTRRLRKLGLGIHPMVGLLPASLIYLLFPLPIGLAYGRFWMELDADRESWKWKLENDYLSPTHVRFRAENFARTVSGMAYLYAWPEKWAVKKFVEEANKVIHEYQSKTKLG